MKKCIVDYCGNEVDCTIKESETGHKFEVCSKHVEHVTNMLESIKKKVQNMTEEELENRLEELNTPVTIH